MESLKIHEMGGEELERWRSWLEGVDRPSAVVTPVFDVDFNLEYWACQLFGGDSKEPRKVYEVHNALEEVVGRLEVGSYAGMNLEPFDRLVMLALIQLWYDQGCDVGGRVAFSYRELFRRLGLRAGGRQSTQVKDSLDRLRRCFITLTNCFVTRTQSGEVVPVEAEADPFTILRLKQTATVGSGNEAQRLVVCQLSQVLLTGLREPGRLRPRVHSGVLRKLRAKHSIAILLHGYYNGRLKMGEEGFFEYKTLGSELRMKEQYHSNLVNRLLSPHEKLEKIGAIRIREDKGERRQRGLTIKLLAPAGEDEPVSIRIEQEPTRVPLEERDKDQLPLFEEAVVEYDEQLLLAFRAAGVKNIKFLLKKYGPGTPERTLWALLENVRAKNDDPKWEWRRGADAYVAKCLNDGFYVPEEYQAPKERMKAHQQQQLEQQRVVEQELAQREARASQREALAQSFDETTRRALEEASIARLLELSPGLRGLLREDPAADPAASLEQRYAGLSNRIVRDAYERAYNALLDDML